MDELISKIDALVGSKSVLNAEQSIMTIVHDIDGIISGNDSDEIIEKLFNSLLSLFSINKGNFSVHYEGKRSWELGELGSSLNHTIKDLQELIEKNYVAELAKEKAENKALMSDNSAQSTPHKKRRRKKHCMTLRSAWGAATEGSMNFPLLKRSGTSGSRTTAGSVSIGSTVTTCRITRATGTPGFPRAARAPMCSASILRKKEPVK